MGELKLCSLSIKPVKCYGVECPYFDRCEGSVFVAEHIEVRIRGEPGFVLSCLNPVVEDMIDAKYIEEKMPSPFNPNPKEPKKSGIIYATKQGTIIMDDLSKKEKVMQMRYDRKKQDGEQR